MSNYTFSSSNMTFGNDPNPNTHFQHFSSTYSCSNPSVPANFIDNIPQNNQNDIIVFESRTNNEIPRQNMTKSNESMNVLYQQQTNVDEVPLYQPKMNDEVSPYQETIIYENQQHPQYQYQNKIIQENPLLQGKNIFQVSSEYQNNQYHTQNFQPLFQSL